MASKTNVAVLMGGKSSEHEISLMSGREVVKFLNSKKYNVFPVKISYDGTNWQTGKNGSNFVQPPAGATVNYQLSTINCFKNIDIVFITLHGPNGEDGSVQGFLQLADVAYTGSKILASALAMDKVLSRKILQSVNLTVPEYLIYKKTNDPKKIWANLNLPIMVKPSDQGSSVGITKVSSRNQIVPALKKAFRYSNPIIIEEFIEGTEITGAVLGRDKPIALPLIEIVSKNDFFDYEAKYNESKCDEICPARIDKKLTKKAQDTAIKAYKTLNCEGFGRVDMIIKNNDIYVLEINTIPGLTSVSLLPKAAKAAGINYPKLLDKIISYAN